VDQSGFLTVLHLINSPPIYFEARPGHRSNRQVEPSFKTIAFQMRYFQFSQYLGSWVWKVYMGWYRFLFRLHPLKLFILKKSFVYPDDLGFFYFLFFVLQNSILLKLNFVFFFFLLFCLLCDYVIRIILLAAGFDSLTWFC
jgi:hypothetical protein